MLLAVIVVLVAVFFVATGRGGELSRERPDYAPLDLGPVAATDIALLRPPTAMWGYNVKATDEALDVIARAMRERDAKIAYLEQRLAAIIPDTAQDPQPPRAPRPVSALPSLQALQVPRDLPAPQAHPGPQDQDDTQILQALYELRTPQTAPEQVVRDDDTQRLVAYGARPAEAAPLEAAPSHAVPSGAVPSETAPSGAVPSGAAPSDAVPSETAPAEAGQPRTSEDPETGQHPEHPAGEEDIVPWDGPAGQQTPAASAEPSASEHPGHQDDLAAGEDPAGSRAGE